jgi:hypothetical protein
MVTNTLPTPAYELACTPAFLWGLAWGVRGGEAGIDQLAGSPGWPPPTHLLLEPRTSVSF